MLKNVLFIWHSNLPGHPVFYLVTLHRKPWLELCPRTAWTNTLQCSSGSLWGLSPSLIPLPPAAAWVCSLHFVPLHPTVDVPCPFSLILQHSSLRGCGVWPSFTDFIGRVEGLYSSAQSRKRTSRQLSGSRGPEFHHSAPKGASSPALLPVDTLFLSLFFQGFSPLLQATSQHHPNPCFFIIQPFSILSHFFPILIISGGEVGIHFHDKKTSSWSQTSGVLILPPHLLAVWPLESYLTSLCFMFLISKTWDDNS